MSSVEWTRAVAKLMFGMLIHRLWTWTTHQRICCALAECRVSATTDRHCSGPPRDRCTGSESLRWVSINLLSTGINSTAAQICQCENLPWTECVDQVQSTVVPVPICRLHCLRWNVPNSLCNSATAKPWTMSESVSLAATGDAEITDELGQLM